MKETNDQHIANARALIAFEFGRLAYHKGIHCAPALDRNVLGMIPPGTPIGSSDTLTILNAWTKGWTLENLAQPVK